ncbi:MAG: glycosyltransferase [Saprospiraceae bacterium]|nr:glycosyltransferase [Saprospiraceae bacterium]
MDKQSGLLSIILLSYQSADKLATVSSLIKEVLKTETIPYELLIMDDGSTDASYSVAKSLEKIDKNIKAYRLSRNYGAQYSQFAGLSVAKGDCIIFLPDDLQRPLSLVVDMYRQWQNGHKLVIAHRNSRNDGIISDWFSGFFYKLMNRFSHVNFPPGGADGFLADRELIDILNTRISPINTTPIIEILNLGFEPKFLPFDRPTVKSKSRWTFRKKWNLALNSFFSASSSPLKFISWLGLTMFTISILLFCLFIFSKLFLHSTILGFPVSGWTTIVLLIIGFNGLVLFCLGIIAEYIWRIFEEIKGRPTFIIRKDNEK